FRALGTCAGRKTASRVPSSRTLQKQGVPAHWDTLQRACRPRASADSMGKLDEGARAADALPPAGVSPAPASPTTPIPCRPRGVRHLDLEGPPAHSLAVEPLDRLGGILGRGHLHEAEATGAARVAIRHYRRRFDRADPREQLTQPVLGRREGEASDEQFVGHGHPPNRSPSGGGTPWNADNSTRVAVWLRERFRANQQPDQTVA